MDPFQRRYGQFILGRRDARGNCTEGQREPMDQFALQLCGLKKNNNEQNRMQVVLPGVPRNNSPRRLRPWNAVHRTFAKDFMDSDSTKP